MHNNGVLDGVKDTYGYIFVSSKVLFYLITMQVWKTTEHYKGTYVRETYIFKTVYMHHYWYGEKLSINSE